MLYKRRRSDGTLGKVWWTRFTIGGVEVKQSSKTDRKTLAEEFERRLREELWREIELGEVRHAWEEAIERWLKEKAHKRSLARDKEAFAAVADWLTGMAVVDIDADRLRDVRGALVETPERRIGRPRQPSTINRILACVRSVLNECVRWGWLASVPKVEPAYEEKRPPKWITKEKFELLWRELPDHARQIVRFAVAVGPRSRNIFGLKWEDVDLVAGVFRVSGAEFKGKRSVGFPLPPEAREVLLQQQGRHPVYVFTDQLGRAPIGSIKTCWYKATIRAGLAGLRLHEMRHTWAAWHKLAGTPPAALKELGGWSDIRMVDRYGHINPQDYAQYADNQRTNSGTRKNEK